MSGRATSCTVYISHHTPKINRRDSILNDLWVRSGHTPGDGLPPLKTDQFSIEENDCLLSTSLVLVNERREVDMVKMAHYQQKLKQGYDKRVKSRPLAPGDLVLRKVVGPMKNPS